MKNPISSARIVAVDYDSRNYTRQSSERGAKDYVMSRSALTEFAACPSRWVRTTDTEDETKSTLFGSLVDCLLTDRIRFLERFAIRPEKYPVVDKKGEPTGEEKDWNSNSNWCKEWIASQKGKSCIPKELYGAAQEAIQRVDGDAVLSAILHDCDYQVYICGEYVDNETGLSIPVKALLDIVPKGTLENSIIDFKTSRCGCPKSWGRELFKHGYHVQAAMQLDLYNAATGEARSDFRHIVLENFKPFEVSKPYLDSAFVTLGRNTYLSALQLYARCLAENHWASYDDLQRDTYDGWPIVSPEAWMVSEESAQDPDWMTEKEAAI